MDEITARIKEYALVIDPTMTDNSRLDFIVSDVIDRATIYMKRDGVVITNYEDDLADTTVDPVDYVLPIPTALERPLAQVVVKANKTLVAQLAADTGAVTRVIDNGQEVDFSEKVTSFFDSSSDSDIFSGCTKLLNRYILAKVIDNTNKFYTSYWN